MKLIGQYDSPFVRRVAVALQIYGIVYDHVPWSTFGDGDLVARHNPLKRVPALVLVPIARCFRYPEPRAVRRFGGLH